MHRCGIHRDHSMYHAGKHHRARNENDHHPGGILMRYQFMTDVNKYIDKIAQHQSASTVYNKQRKLRLIADNFKILYEEGKVSTNNPRKITTDDIEAYVGFRRSNNISDATLSKDLCLLNQLCKSVGNEVVKEFRDFDAIYRPHAYSGMKDPMLNSVIDRVIELGRSTESFEILEGCTAILLCSSAGLRTQEARKMYASDVLTGPQGQVFLRIVHVKGEGSYGHQRTAIVMDGVEDIILRYVEERKKRLAMLGMETDSLFPPMQRGGEFYTQQGFCKLKAPIEKILDTKIELRSGRRAFGQRLLDCGNQVEDVSVMMGHASTKTTELYYARGKESLAMARVYGNRNNRPFTLRP